MYESYNLWESLVGNVHENLAIGFVTVVSIRIASRGIILDGVLLYTLFLIMSSI
jgi:hypothetical protein